MKKLLLAAVAALSFNLAAASKWPASSSTTRPMSATGDLLVNGAGLRKKAVFKVYAMALYLPEKRATAEACWRPRGQADCDHAVARPLGQQFVEALQEGMANNHSEAEMAGLKDRLKQFSDTLLAIGEAQDRDQCRHRLAAGERHTPDGQRAGQGQGHRRRGFLQGAAEDLAWQQAGAGRPQTGAARQGLLSDSDAAARCAHWQARCDYQAVIAAPVSASACVATTTKSTGSISCRRRPEVAPGNARWRPRRRASSPPTWRTRSSLSVLPLRPSGTPFQRRVWQQIAAIPTHQTRSYGEIAKALHNAPRAVGQACGANPFPVVVPCHRVLAAGGGLGGFARQGRLSARRQALAAGA
jgi:methylated-DNA-[protein]-cysteine S-methyltransferase